MGTKRNADQEWPPSEACRETNIAEHPASVHSVSEHTSSLLGIDIPSGQASGYAEPGAENTPGKESLKPNVGGSGVMKRSRSKSDTGMGLSWPPPAALDSSLTLSYVPYNPTPGYSSPSGYAEPMASSAFSMLSNQYCRVRTPSNASTRDPFLSRSPDDGTEQDAGQRSSRKRRRLVKDEDDFCTKDVTEITLKLGRDEEMTETGKISSLVDRDIVDVLLEEWTVPVY